MKFVNTAKLPNNAKVAFGSCHYFVASYKRIFEEAQQLILEGRDAFDPLVVSFETALERAAQAIYTDAMLSPTRSWTWQTAREFGSLAYYAAHHDRGLGRHSNGTTRAMCEVHATEVLETLLDSGDWGESLDFASAIAGVRGIAVAPEHLEKILHHAIDRKDARMHAQTMLCAREAGVLLSTEPLALPAVAIRPEAPDTRILIMECVADTSPQFKGSRFQTSSSQSAGGIRAQSINYHIGCFGDDKWFTHETLGSMTEHIPRSFTRTGQPEKIWALSVSRALSLMEAVEALFARADHLDATKLIFSGLEAEKVRWKEFLNTKIFGHREIGPTLQQFNPRLPRDMNSKLERLRTAASRLTRN
jgi:hypothetical protein